MTACRSELMIDDKRAGGNRIADAVAVIGLALLFSAMEQEHQPKHNGYWCGDGCEFWDWYF